MRQTENRLLENTEKAREMSDKKLRQNKLKETESRLWTKMRKIETVQGQKLKLNQILCRI